MKLGEVLRKWRKESLLTVRGAAKQIGIAYPTLLRTIWVVQSGEYEDRCVNLIAVSPEAAREGLIEQHRLFQIKHPEYKDKSGWNLTWGPLRQIAVDEYGIISKWHMDTVSGETIYSIEEYDFAA